MTEQAGGDGNGGGGEASVTELQATVAKLEGQIGEIDKAKTELTEKVGDYEKTFMSPEWLNFVDQQKGGEEDEGGEGGTPKSEDKLDLNNYNPTQLAEHLSKGFGVALGKITAASDKRFEDMQTVLVQQLSRVNLELTKLDNPGLSDKLGPKDGKTEEQKVYYEKYFGVAKENPNWSGGKVYKQVEMERAADAHSVEVKEVAQKEKERKALTEHASDTSLSTVEGKDLSPDEAAEIAVTETMSGIGD